MMSQKKPKKNKDYYLRNLRDITKNNISKYYIYGDMRRLKVEISDIKQVYPEFKFFSEIYTKIKIANYVTFYKGPNDKVNLLFSKDSNFYKIYGEIYGKTEFLKWILAGHACSISLEDVRIISKCLKKNALSIEYTDSYFMFKFISKETNEEVTIKLENLSDFKIDNNPIDEIETIENNLPIDTISKTLIRLYRVNDEAMTEKSKAEDLLLEIPNSVVLVDGKTAENLKIKYTKFPEKDKKFVELTTESVFPKDKAKTKKEPSELSKLILSQLFATI